MTPVIVNTLDGSQTLYLKEIDEHYHSVAGAVSESIHVFIKAGFEYCDRENISVFEVGFGTGLNALLTALRSTEMKRHVTYTSVEKCPLDESVINVLNYPHFLGGKAPALFKAIHDAGWGSIVNINRYFGIQKIKCNIITCNIPSISADIVYFDAFAPSKQPEMWSMDMVEKVTGIIGPGGIFVTYSAKGELRRMLRGLGFEVSRLPGASGKREMTRAIKT